MDLVALSNGLHGSVQMDSVALFSWIGWLRHHGILTIIKLQCENIINSNKFLAIAFTNSLNNPPHCFLHNLFFFFFNTKRVSCSCHRNSFVLYNRKKPIINSFKILYWSACLHLKLSLNLPIDNVKFIIHTKF